MTTKLTCSFFLENLKKNELERNKICVGEPRAIMFNLLPSRIWGWCAFSFWN